jgi:predicted nucleic acid-binding protein
MAFTALLDANVLYSAPLRDLLLRLALTDLYRAKWSADIHGEWMRNLARDRPDIHPARIEATRLLMDSHVRNAMVEGYAHLIPSLSLPDPDDRHVLAAAIHGRADVIVTYNLNDFPVQTLATYGIEAQHPDEFLRHEYDLAPDLVCAVVRELRGGLKCPPRTVDQYLATLEKHGLCEFVTALRLRAHDFDVPRG